jgi:hypothetical protein
MGWKQDRILTFIWAGQFLNDKLDKKFYFDVRDKIFFSLYFQDNQYKIFYKHPSNLTAELKHILLGKIEKIKTSSSDILEIKKNDQKYDYSPSIPAKNKDESKHKMELEKEMAKFVFKFLEDNNIDLETADVIELH